MFRKYECGCIGCALFIRNEKRVLCFYSCDGDGERSNQIHRRDILAEKESRPLTALETIELLDTISDLVRDGYALRELRLALRVAGVEVKP
jgi:hypothetical protein